MRAFLREHLSIKIFITVVVVLVWLNVFRVGYIHFRAPRPTEPTVSEDTEIAERIKALPIKEERFRFTYPEGDLQNPFQRDRATIAESIAPPPIQKAEPALILTAVLWDEKSPLAILREKATGENHTVKVGDSVLGIRVEEIKKESVILGRGSGRFVLEVFPPTSLEKAQEIFPPIPDIPK